MQCSLVRGCRKTWLGAMAGLLLACSSEVPANGGALRGTLMVYVATLDDGTSRTDYRLFVDGSENDARLLVFPNPPDLESGAELEVFGETSGREVIVRRFDVLENTPGDRLGTSEEAI